MFTPQMARLELASLRGTHRDYWRVEREADSEKEVSAPKSVESRNRTSVLDSTVGSRIT